ncbi:hypothetical protein CPAV1605_807 [seawater metagenome]|uniref:Uncharacterized protein n=1 Tax=seawater metagenome TaxID=1561972 RepID=A0A5E8CLX1_9ZZZZ
MLEEKMKTFNNDPSKTPTLVDFPSSNPGDSTPIVGKENTSTIENAKMEFSLDLKEGQSFLGDLSKNKLYQRRLRSKNKKSS